MSRASEVSCNSCTYWCMCFIYTLIIKYTIYKVQLELINGAVVMQTECSYIIWVLIYYMSAHILYECSYIIWVLIYYMSAHIWLPRYFLTCVVACLVYEMQPAEKSMTLIWLSNAIQGQILWDKIKFHVGLTMFHTNFDHTIQRLWSSLTFIWHLKVITC